MSSCVLSLILLAITGFVPTSPARARCGDSGVTVFSAYWCPYCKMTERFLALRGVRYRRIEVEGRRHVERTMLDRFGTTAVPRVVVDGRHWAGHDERRLRRALCLD